MSHRWDLRNLRLSNRFALGGSTPKRKENRIQQLMRILPWLALGCAFSPVLIQLANEVREAPFGWSLLLAPALMLAAASRCSRDAPPRRGWAPALLFAGLLIELIGLGGGSPGVANLGLPISVVGLALWTGIPAPMTALLALWAIPVPGSFYGLTTPNLESAYADLGVAFARMFGAELHSSGPLLRSGGEHLELDPHDSGIHLAFVMTQLCWYAAIRQGRPPIAALARTAGAALFALPLQLFAVCIAALLLAFGTSGAANFWLDHGALLLTVGLGMAWIETRRTHAVRSQ